MQGLYYLLLYIVHCCCEFPFVIIRGSSVKVGDVHSNISREKPCVSQQGRDAPSSHSMVLGLGMPSTADHLADQFLEGGAELPSDLLLGLGGIAEEKFDLSGAEVLGIDFNQDAILIVGINTNLVDGAGLALPLDGSANNGECTLDELANGVGLSGGQDVVIGLLLLEHAPHTLNVVAATAGTLVVKEDAVGNVHAVGLTVVDKDPEGVLLGNGVGRAGVEGGGLGLRDLLNLSVKLGGGGLVEADLLLHAASADGIEHTEDTNAVGVSGVLGHIEGNLDVGHGTEVVDFGGADLGDDGDQVGGIAEIAVVKEELDAGGVTVLVEMVNAAGVEGRRTTDNAVDGISLLEKELGKVRSVLAGDAGDEGDLSVFVGRDFSRHVVVFGCWKMVEMTSNELAEL